MILFARVWRGKLRIDSLRILPDEDAAIKHAIKVVKKSGIGDPMLEANFIQAWEVFESEEPKRVKRFPARVQESLT